MRRIGLDTLVPDLKRMVGDCNREELLAVAAHQRDIEKTHADALSRSARTGSSAPEEAYETAWRTHCRAHVYAALAEPLAPGMAARAHWQPAQLAEIWEQGCAAAHAAPWQVHAATVRARDGDRARGKTADAAPTGKGRLRKDGKPVKEGRPPKEVRRAREERRPEEKRAADAARPAGRARAPAKAGPAAEGRPRGNPDARPRAGADDRPRGTPRPHAETRARPDARSGRPRRDRP